MRILFSGILIFLLINKVYRTIKVYILYTLAYKNKCLGKYKVKIRKYRE